MNDLQYMLYVQFQYVLWYCLLYCCAPIYPKGVYVCCK